MPTIAVIVEGDYDEVAIPALVKRRRKGVKVIARQCRGPVHGKFLGIVAELNRSDHPDRVLVVSDSDGRNPEQVASAIESRNKASAVVAALFSKPWNALLEIGRIFFLVSLRGWGPKEEVAGRLTTE